MVSCFRGEQWLPVVRDVIVIGAGVNGLVAATYLAKGGVKPLVLERSERVGGCAITTEIAPGFTLQRSLTLRRSTRRSSDRSGSSATACRS